MTRAGPGRAGAGKLGALFHQWRMLVSGFSPTWAKLCPRTRRALEAGNLSDIGHRSLTLANSTEPEDMTQLSRIWYTVVVCASEPIQTSLPSNFLLSLIDCINRKVCNDFCSSRTVADGKRHLLSHLNKGVIPPKELLLYMFPRKAHPLAGRKANLFLDKMLRDLHRVAGALIPTVARQWSLLNPGDLTDDQACSSLLYAYSAAHVVGFERGLAIATWAVLRPEIAGSLSDILKATGVNGTIAGSLLCELKTLIGRGTNPCDLGQDAQRRLVAKLDLPLVRVSTQALAEAVDDILAEELMEEVTLPSIDDFWSTRFRWCVGGSHNLATNRHWQGDNPHMGMVDSRVQWNRRAASEVTRDEPLSSWSGRVEVSVAEKLEHGKGRAIYSCDTLSYYAFSWLLRPVELAWRSRRVILDPGRDGSVGMFNRIRGLCDSRTSPVFTMLDYSDFNSQHTLESQAVVIERLLLRVGHSEPELASKLVASFNKMYIRFKGRILGRVGGSLMSGHRGTTFLNSVLNAAYLRLALGRSLYNSIQSLHVGDDVLVVASSEELGWRTAHKLERLGCSLQPSKQSVGRHVFEFLRMAGHPKKGGHGYLARSVAGLVSGNWVTDFRATPLEALHSLVQQARSIINRSRNPCAWRLMLSSAAAITGLEPAVLCDLLSGEVAIAPGPCYRNDGRYLFRYISEEGSKSEDVKLKKLVARYPNFASTDYIERGLDKIEREGVRLAGMIPWRAMALSSFKAMELSRRVHVGADCRPGRLVCSGIGVRMKSGVRRCSELTTTARKHGLLAHLPILSLLKGVLTGDDLRSLLRLLGKEYDETNLRLAAWGGTLEGATIVGDLPYSDAAGSASRVLSSAVLADIGICM